MAQELDYRVTLEDFISGNASKAARELTKLSKELTEGKAKLAGYEAQLKLAKDLGDIEGYRKYPSLALPPSFDPSSKPADRSPTRGEFLQLVPTLSPDAAAVTAFILATSAEWAALTRSKRSDIPQKIVAPLTIHIRGSKTEGRDRHVAIVTDEQVTLLKFVAKHAQGEGGKLFSGLANYNRALAVACESLKIESASAHDWRHGAGQWLIDLGVPIEIVSKFLGHASTAITERIYARVRDDQVGDRMLDALDPRYTRGASRTRSKASRKIATVTSIPDPRLPVLYEANGLEKTLTEWAQHYGIPKNTLWHRLHKQGMTMSEALAAGKLPGKNGTDRHRLAPHPKAPEEPKHREIPVRRGGIEPPTRGFSVPCSTD
jgi:integrase